MYIQRLNNEESSNITQWSRVHLRSAQIHKTWMVTRALVYRSVFSSSPPGCCSSASSHSCRAAPWCFAGWAQQCLAGASGRDPRSSRPPSAASTPHRNRANAPVWLLDVTVTSAYFMLWIVLWSHCSSRLDWTRTDSSTGYRPTTFDGKSKINYILNVTKGSWDF